MNVSDDLISVASETAAPSQCTVEPRPEDNPHIDEFCHLIARVITRLSSDQQVLPVVKAGAA